jgi:hypothetical protein
MSERNLLISYFALAGLVGGLGATLFLWHFVGPEYSGAVLGFRHIWFWFVFPVVGAALSAFWARLFGEAGFGVLRGALVSFLAFVSFCGILSLVGPGGPWAFFAFSFFGFVLVGWALVVLGAVTGWLFRRQVVAKHSNYRVEPTR